MVNFYFPYFVHFILAWFGFLVLLYSVVLGLLRFFGFACFSFDFDSLYDF